MVSLERSSNSFLEQLQHLLNHACNQTTEPDQLVDLCAPRLSELLMTFPEDVEILTSQLSWPDEGDQSYTRQRILEAENGDWSVYAICWLPGQYTPVHDHGTWGVVGVMRGRLHEHQMAVVEHDEERDLYQLAPAGICLLTPGAINTFVPEPDHIHRSGVPLSGTPTASIHLYGRLMTHYHAYDVETGLRTRLDVE